MSDEIVDIIPCPSCGALPCDQTTDPRSGGGDVVELRLDTEAEARELLAREYERNGPDGSYPTYADLARTGNGAFTLCSIRAVMVALSRIEAGGGSGSSSPKSEDTQPGRSNGGSGSETWASMFAWTEETFGPVTLERIATRANEEMQELLADPSDVTEAADVCIVLSRYPGIAEAINKKMAINRGRQWRLNGDGSGYHVKDIPHPAKSDSSTGGES